MLRINDWYCFTEELDKNTCDKIKNSTEYKWKKSIIDIKKSLTDEERAIGATSIPGIDQGERKSETVWIEDLRLAMSDMLINRGLLYPE